LGAAGHGAVSQGLYSDNEDLSKLYALVAERLSLAPSQHTETTFKAILGNCQSVVKQPRYPEEQDRDAHGKGAKAVRPLPRHAQLAVNLAGTMATFLVETWQARRAGGS